MAIANDGVGVINDVVNTSRQRFLLCQPCNASAAAGITCATIVNFAIPSALSVVVVDILLVFVEEAKGGVLRRQGH